MTPSEIVSKMVSLHCASELSRGGYAMRSGYDAQQMLVQMLADLLESGAMLSWANAFEDQELRNRLEVFS